MSHYVLSFITLCIKFCQITATTLCQIFHFVMGETVQCISGFEHSCSTGNLRRNKMSLTMWPSRMRQNVTLRVTFNVSFCSYVKMSHKQVTFCRFICDIFKCDKRTHKRYHHMCLFVACTKGHIKGHITFTSVLGETFFPRRAWRPLQEEHEDRSKKSVARGIRKI